ncbi:MAG: AAA family ATPase [Pseudomonadota bacterium]|nr:AAA family ATPase [Pseudomonadota bacterium]
MFTVNKLKISGFKSFANPTELLIEDGVTGIIGPNGCGKSNIFEAIRWVMGESSSKSLRSGSMDDVIFNGTQNIPAKNIAEVTIELDDFQGELPGSIIKEKKLIINRTIERGVGSFYKINNKDVRARDISIIFYDSGSGPRSSSIISQGNIDQIINSKPIDRKIILEDAAGTSGLQARRHESELKLQATEDNLGKIDINLDNLNEQKKSLSRQARQADKYELISENIKSHQSILVFTQWKKVTNEIEETLINKEKYTNEIKLIINESKKNQYKFDEEKKKIGDLQNDKEVLNKKIYQISTEVNKYTNQLEGINTKRREIQKFLDTIKNDKDIEKKRFSELKDYIISIRKKISLPSDLNQKKKRLIELTTQEAELKNKLKQSETLFVNEIQLSLGEEFKFDNLKETKENLLKNKEEIKNNSEAISKDLDVKENDLKSTKKLAERLREDIQKLQLSIHEKKNNINETNKHNQNINDYTTKILSQIESSSTKLTQIKTELKTLNLLTNNQGISNDSVVNLLKIKKGFENAVYAALTNELDAKLKKSSKRWVKKNIDNIKNIDNALAKYVSGPKELDLILSQIGFISDTNEAIEKQKKLEVGQMLVNKDGFIWRWDGFISHDNFQNKKLIDSQLKIKKLVEEQNICQQTLNDLGKKKENTLDKQSEYNKKLSKENSELEKLHKEVDLSQSNLSKLREKISILTFNIDSLKTRLSSLQIESKKILKEIENIESKEISSNKTEDIKNERELVQKNIEELDLKLESKRDQITEIKESIMKEELNETYLENDLLKTQNRLIECEKQIKILNDRETDYLQENKKLNDLPANLKKQIDHYQGLYNELNKDISENENNQIELKRIAQNIDEKLISLNRNRENKRNEVTRLDSNLENFKSKEKELRNVIFQRSSIQPEDLENDLINKKADIQNYEEIKLKLDRLIQQREQMGPVNLRAKIEEKNINQSIEELELEKMDLSQAIEKLRIAINKINHEGKNRLLKAYENVNKNFSDLFVKLFEGGEAKLELIKSDDPLQTGIEIFARPPGKKLSSISLLSGGEKALTAIALIFSIFLINPSPICILDEVDAALDEPNVEKFCKILSELKKETKTKFLIITHHKVTMSSIDRVYGVTMAQKGISDIVSVDFSKTSLKEAV